MIHPLVPDFSELKDAELEAKVQDLTRKYYQTTNSSVKYQITVLMDVYNAELSARRAKLWQQQYQKRDKDLDKLINIT